MLLSGEHETLPYLEVLTLLETELAADKISLLKKISYLDQVLRIDVDSQTCARIAEKCGYVHLCCEEIFVTKQNLREIERAVNSMEAKNLQRYKRIALKIIYIKEYGRKLDVECIEKIILDGLNVKIPGFKLDYKNPEITFVGVLTEDKFLFGRVIAAGSRRQLIQRSPGRRPFFHPSSLSSLLARGLLNISGYSGNDIIVDPFCGTGTIPIEAALLGLRAVGIDINPKLLVKGARANTRVLAGQGEALVDYICGDILLPPLRENILYNIIIVTDPPYGRCASTHGRNSLTLLRGLLSFANKLVNVKQIVFLMPHWLKVADIVEGEGKPATLHFMRVHGGLFRKIVIFYPRPN